MTRRIGLVGNGFVGEAFYEGMKHKTFISVWDTNPDKRNVNSMETLVNTCNVIFVSVPTPMREDGECDTSIVMSVVNEIKHWARQKCTKKIVVIRSTVPPGTCRHLHDPTNGICIVFNPEFLTEANYINDFKNQSRIILAGDSADTNLVAEIYNKSFPTTDIINATWEVAEMVKYTANTFLSMKVSFANEIYDICNAAGIEYNDVIEIATADNRLGTSHWKVPGPDGHRGFAGSCFPKDINGLMSYARELRIPTPILDAVWRRNVKIDRPEKDWELLVGRAVS